MKLLQQVAVLGALGLAQDVAASVAGRMVGPSVTTGQVTASQGSMGNLYNPASGDLYRRSIDSDATVVGAVYLAAGLEYGDVDDLIALIDDLAERIEGDKDPDGDNGGDNGGDSGEDLNPPIWLPPDIDLNDPDVIAAIDNIKTQVSVAAALVGFVAAEGYSRVYIASELPVLINKEIWGGTLNFDLTVGTQGGAIGLAENIGFDQEVALEALEGVKSLTEDSPATEFDLSGGLILTIDPSNRDIRLRLENDSTLLTKAVRLYELDASYSRMWGEYESGQLYVGVKPKIMRLGMSNVATRIGDLTDADAFFDEILDRDFEYSTEATFDVGALWVAPNYHVGATIKNMYEGRFKFPEFDNPKIKSEEILALLESSRTYQLERQLKIEAGWNDNAKKWNANFSIDTNVAMDPVGNLNQWLSVSGSYKPSITWLPSVRFGHHQNLKGTRVKYAAVGATMFKYFEVDLGLSLDQVEISGNDLPRGLNLTFGFNYGF